MRKTAKDFDQRVLDLFDGYVHGLTDRREFLDRAAKYTAAGVSAVVLLDSLSPDYALAAQVAEDDAGISTARIEYDLPNGNGTIRAYLTMPANATDPLPGVVVVHENRGLNPYIEDVARRVAAAGFVGLAPDGLTPLGGYPAPTRRAARCSARSIGAKLLQDFFAAFEHLKGHDSTTSKVGVVGFCYGGGVCNAMAVNYPDLAASVPFYGRQAAAADVPKNHGAAAVALCRAR